MPVSAVLIGGAVDWAIGRVGDVLTGPLVRKLKEKRARSELLTIIETSISGAADAVPTMAGDLRSEPFLHVLAVIVLNYIADPSDGLTPEELGEAYTDRFIAPYLRGRDLDETLQNLLQTDRSAVNAALAGFIGQLRSGLYRSEHWREAAVAGSVEEIRLTLASLVAEPAVRAIPTPSEGVLEEARKDARAGSSDLLNWPRTVAGLSLGRPELDELIGRIRGEPYGRTLVVGEAGSGKSALLSELTEKLQKEGMTVFGIKADMLPPEVHTLEDVSTAIGLAGSIEAELETLARAEPVVLVIDQLDAVSEVMDRTSARMKLLIRLANRFRRESSHDHAAPPVHVVVSSRPFEAQHDGRFQALNAKTVKLELPPFERVAELLGQLGVNADELSAGMRETVRRPFALKLVVDLTARGVAAGELTSAELLNSWIATADLGDADLRPSVLEFLARLAADMTAEETLWRPADVYDFATSQAVRVAEASGLIVRQNGQLGFSHQSWLDDFQAKGFNTGKDVAEYTWSRQDGLFVRATMLRALQRLRAHLPQSYEVALDELLGKPQTRRHIRHLVVDILSSQSAPFVREEKWVQRLIREDMPLARRAINKVGENWSAWRGAIKVDLPFLMTPPDLRWSAVQLLLAEAKIDPDGVVDLISQRWSDVAFDGDVFEVFWRGRIWSQRVLERLRELFKRGSWADFAVAEYMSGLRADGRPEAAVDLLALFLDCRERQQHGHPAFHEVEKLARETPLNFSTAMLKWFHGLAMEDVDHDPSLRRVFSRSRSLPFDWNDPHEEGSVFAALRSALDQLAKDEPSRLSEVFAPYSEIELDEVQALIADTYAANPSALFREGFEFLIGDPRRLVVGNACIQDVEEVLCAVDGWSSQQLLRKVSPYLSAEQLDRLRQFIEEWDPFRPEIWEGISPSGKRDRIQWARDARFELLRHLPATTVDTRTARQIQEWSRTQRQFGPNPKIGASVGFVGSPMSADQMSKANDDDLFGMLDEVCDGTGWGTRKRRSISREGGVVQLAREFAAFGKSDPERALGLARRFEPGKHEEAAGALVHGLAEAGVVEPERLLALIRDLSGRGFSSADWRTHAAWAMASIAGQANGLSDDDIHMVEGWIVDDPEVTALRISRRENNEAVNKAHNRQLHNEPEISPPRAVLFGRFGGMSVLPQDNFVLLSAMCSGFVRREPSDYNGWLGALERHLPRSEDPAIWAALLAHRGQLLYWADRDWTKTFFTNLHGHHPLAFQNAHVGQALWPARAMVPCEVQAGMITQWLTDPETKLHQAAGEFAMASALLDPLDQTMAEIAKELMSGGDHAARLGCLFSIAGAWGANVGDPRARAHALLMEAALTAAGDDAVAVSTAFDVAKDEYPDEQCVELLGVLTKNAELLAACVDSRFMDAMQGFLLYPGLEEAVLPIVEQAADIVISGGQQRAGGLIGGDLVTLAIALQRSSGPQQKRAMDVYERLLDAQVYGADQAAASSLRP